MVSNNYKGCHPFSALQVPSSGVEAAFAEQLRALLSGEPGAPERPVFLARCLKRGLPAGAPAAVAAPGAARDAVLAQRLAQGYVLNGLESKVRGWFVNHRVPNRVYLDQLACALGTLHAVAAPPCRQIYPIFVAADAICRRPAGVVRHVQAGVRAGH